MDTIRKSFGRSVQHWRKTKGMTQEELAEEARLSWSHLNAIEGGRKSPSIETIQRIADALHVTARDLFDFQAPKPTAGTHDTIERISKVLEGQPKGVLAHVLHVVQTILKIRRIPGQP